MLLEALEAGRSNAMAVLPPRGGAVMGKQVKIVCGDSLEVLRKLPDDCIDSVVTDPPYELAFMGKSWDASGVAHDSAIWEECLRVLKPGGHILAFGGSRTWHRLAVAIEDAGFEIRDSVAWLYGSGFPKSLNVGKAAAQWEGWGTALKPAFEPIVMGRKPIKGTVVQNVLEHGTGALNIDATRIGTADGFGGGAKGSSGFVDGYERGKSGGFVTSGKGRWPANVIVQHADECEQVDENGNEVIPAWQCVEGCQVAVLDAQSGHLHGSGNKSDTGTGEDVQYDASSFHVSYQGRANRDYGAQGGGASRFFYTAKANKKERPTAEDGSAHPTVKPIAIMSYLIKLVTQPGGIVLDPFGGSGTTAEAALMEGMRCIIVEKEAQYIPMIEQRVARAEAKMVVVG
jgi:site-specific DNA-methyltransferase (adenine-specific)